MVAERAGSTIEALRRRNDRGFAIATMAEGVAAVLSEQLSKDDLDGVFALGEPRLIDRSEPCAIYRWACPS